MHACVYIARYTIDLIVCVALGADIFDCVYPTRTAVSNGKDIGYNNLLDIFKNVV